MATVNYFQTANMVNPYAWQTTGLISATASSYTVTDNLGFSATFYGSFTYSAGALEGGTVTGYDISHNNALEYTIRDANLDALVVNNYITAKDAVGLQQYTLSGDDTITGSAGVDVLRGWGGNDTYLVDMVVKNSPAGSMFPVYIDFQDTVIEGANAGTDTIKPLVNNLLASQEYIAHDAAHANDYWVFKIPDGRMLANNVENMDESATAIFHDTTAGNNLDNVLIGNVDHNHILGYGGNDTITGNGDWDIIDGGTGIDTAIFNINRADIAHVRHLKFGGFTIETTEGADLVYNVEKLQFLDGTISGTDPGSSGDIIRDLLATRPLPTFAGATSAVTRLSNNAVPHLEYQYMGDIGNDNVIGSTGNDFIALGDGNDAAVGGLGDDTLEGGKGSNFLTGDLVGATSGGHDSFYIDGRGADIKTPGNNAWSGFTDFRPGEDDAVIWGWVAGTSKLVFSVNRDGAVGYEGATFHYDLDGNNSIDISITFTGLSLAEVPTAKAGISGIYGYLAFA